MREKGYLLKEDENQDESFFIEKGKEFGRKVMEKVKQEKVDKLFSNLNELKGHFPSEMLQNIKQRFDQNENKLE